MNAVLRWRTESGRLADASRAAHRWCTPGRVPPSNFAAFPLTVRAAKTELAPECRAIERIKRKATAMAVVAATETSLADEVGTEPDLEPDPELHPGGRSCRCPAGNVKAYREEGEWVCHSCGHQLSPRVASLLTLVQAA
jgi:hypothetical protein